MVVIFDDLKGRRNANPQCGKSPYNLQKISWLVNGQKKEATRCYKQAFEFKLIHTS